MRVISGNNLGLDVTYIKLEKGYTMADDRPIQNQYDAMNAVADVIKDLDREVVCLVTLKSNGVPVNASFVSVGTATTAMACPREIMKTALLSNATAILVFHNHPSGGAMPSVQDIQFTDRLKQACDLMDIILSDHVIIGAASKEWFSFAEKGMIKQVKTDYNEIEMPVNTKNTQKGTGQNIAAEKQNVYNRHKAR